MFDITKLALKIPNFLTYDECDRLINEFEQRKNTSVKESSANYNTHAIEESSFDVVPLLPYTNNFNLIKSKTQQAIDRYINYLSKPGFFYTEALRLNLRFSHSYRIMKYEEGASIHPHSDHDTGTYASISFNLNENYEGGEFKFFNGKYTIPLKKGDALIFPADYFWVHEVTPVTKNSRYSINSFILRFPHQITMDSVMIADNLTNHRLHTKPIEEFLGPYSNSFSEVVKRKK